MAVAKKLRQTESGEKAGAGESPNFNDATASRYSISGPNNVTTGELSRMVREPPSPQALHK